MSSNTKFLPVDDFKGCSSLQDSYEDQYIKHMQKQKTLADALGEKGASEECQLCQLAYGHNKKIEKLNPDKKDKPDPTLIPPDALMECAKAMKDGADKYGAYNWREKSTSVRGLIARIIRHALLYLDGADITNDSLLPHPAHIMADAAILLDKKAKLIDDRPGVKK